VTSSAAVVESVEQVSPERVKARPPRSETGPTEETVLEVHHWTDRLFSFRTTRRSGLRFRSGQFIMIGLMVEGRPLMRAYSIASPNYDDHLEFFSIKVPDGPLTSRLQAIQPGDSVLVSRKPVGTLVLDDLRDGENLYMLATGTGLAPFLSLIRDPEVYDRFERIIVVHGVRRVQDLAYRDLLERALPEDELMGEMVRGHLLYYPIVSREPFEHAGRLTTAIDNGQLARDLGLPQLNAQSDRVMICGSMAMLKDVRQRLDATGFEGSPRQGVPGDYVFERAFVDS